MIIIGKVLAEYQRTGHADAEQLSVCISEIHERRSLIAQEGEDALAEFDSQFTKDRLYGRPVGYMDQFERA